MFLFSKRKYFLLEEKYILKKNDIVFARTGNSTGRAYLYDTEDGPLAFAGFLIKYQLDESKVNPKFIRYFTISDYYKQWVNNLSVGSTRGNISAQTFADCPIILPSRKQQDCTVSFLSALDRKIALNRSINRNLEALAKQLYDYWFVQFDFPNEDGRPYKSSGGKMVWNEDLKREIPEGWEVTKLKDLAETEKDQINPQSFPDIHFKHYSLPEFDKTGTYGVELGSEIQSNKFVISENSVMVSKLNTWTNRVICGNDEDNQIGSTEFVVLNPKNVQYKPFIFQLVKSEKFITYCTKGSTGTSHSHRRISPDLLVSFRFAYKKNVVEQYSKTLSKYISLLQENTKNTQMLTKQRNELLPLLMNGQVSVG